jgi:hypothetical protein
MQMSLGKQQPVVPGVLDNDPPKESSLSINRVFVFNEREVTVRRSSDVRA